MIVASTEDGPRRATYTLISIAIKYNMKISVNKTEAIIITGKMNMRTKIVLNNNIIEHVIT